MTPRPCDQLVMAMAKDWFAQSRDVDIKNVKIDASLTTRRSDVRRDGIPVSAARQSASPSAQCFTHKSLRMNTSRLQIGYDCKLHATPRAPAARADAERACATLVAVEGLVAAVSVLHGVVLVSQIAHDTRARHLV